MIKFTYVTVFLLLLYCPTFGQDKEETVKWLNEAKQNIAYNPDLSRAYLDSMKPYLDKNRDEKYLRAEHDKLLGVFFYRKGAYDSSVLYYKRAGITYQQLDSVLDQAKVKVNLSMTYARTGDFEDAIGHATESLVLFERINDTKGMGVAYNMIGQVYFYNNDFNKALQYFKYYIHNAKDSIEQAGGFSNIGSTFEKLEQYDSALFYVNLGLKYHMALNSPYGIGAAHESLGSLYNINGNPRKGIEEYLKAIPYYNTVENNAGLLQVNTSIGALYKNLHDYKNALVYSQRALGMARKLGERYVERETLRIISEIMEKLGKHEASLEYYKAFHVLNDTIYNQETRKNIEEINVAYESNKKTQQIEFLNQENKLKAAANQRNILLITALVILLILLGVVFYLSRHRTKLQQQTILQEQKVRFREMQINAVIDSQEKERKRFASDLHDGMGQLVSALQINIQSIKQNDNLEKRDGLVQNSEQILTEIQDEIRNIAFNLMPPVLVKEGLVSAIEELARRINKADIKTNFIVHGVNERFTSLQEISLYRIIQELVSNILKHAKATELSISITGYEDEVIFLIEDDGDGYDLNSFQNSKYGNGWQTIQTRLNLIQGTIQFDTLVGRKNNTTSIHFRNAQSLTNPISEKQKNT